SVVIAPLLIATGMQNKLLEALAMGKLIVTTPRCAHSLGAQDGVHLLVAADSEAYAKAILKLLDDLQLAEQLGKAGRQFVAERYNWASAANTLNKLYNDIANAPRQEELVANLALVSQKAGVYPE